MQAKVKDKMGRDNMYQTECLLSLVINLCSQCANGYSQPLNMCSSRLNKYSQAANKENEIFIADVTPFCSYLLL